MSFANLVNEIGRFHHDNVIGGFSFLNNKLNKNVSSDIFSLYDVGNLNGGHASAPFDYEGPDHPNQLK